MSKIVRLILALLAISQACFSQSHTFCMRGIVSSVADVGQKFKNNPIASGDSVLFSLTYNLSTQTKDDKLNSEFRNMPNKLDIKIRSYVFKSDDRNTVLYIKKSDNTSTGDNFKISSVYNLFPILPNVNWVESSIVCIGRDTSSAEFSNENLPLEINNVESFRTNINISSNVKDPPNAFFLSIKILEYDCKVITANDISEATNKIYVSRNFSQKSKFILNSHGKPLESAKLFNSQGIDISSCYNANTLEIDLTDKPDGVYFLIYQIADKTFISKILNQYPE